MKINDLYILWMILACCLAILTVLIIILYCQTLKYIKLHHSVSKQVAGIPDDSFWKNLGEEKTALEPDISGIENATLEPDISGIENAALEPDISGIENAALESEISTKETSVSNNETVLPSHTARLFGLSANESAVEVDIIQAAKDAIEALEPFAQAQNIKIHLSTTCEELMIMAIPQSIRILFRNIIDNSIKYMGRAGHMIITISLLGDDIFVILKDTGKGLNEEETTHIFELNFQGSNRVSGNGLGLTQSKMILEAFGGTIYAKSSPENGMAIYIQLPVYKKEG